MSSVMVLSCWIEAGWSKMKRLGKKCNVIM